MGSSFSLRVFVVLLFGQLSFGSTIGKTSENENVWVKTLSEKSNYIYADDLLKRLGFEDFVAQIDTQLKQSENMSDVSVLALQKNRKMLQSINSIRTLAAYLFYLINRFQLAPVEVEAIHELIVQQLSLFPMVHFEPMPYQKQLELQKLSVEKALEVKRKFAEGRARERFLLEKSNIRRLFLALAKHRPQFQIYQSVIKQWLDDHIALAIQDSYIFESRQQNRFLGQALTTVFVAYARLNKWEKLESDLKAKLRSHNLYLENYTEAMYVSDAGKNDLRATSLKSGDVAFEYFHGQESFFTSLVMEPSHPKNEKLVKTYNLQTSVRHAPYFLETQSFYSLLDKVEVYKKLTAEEKFKYKTFWNQEMAKGFSHAGLVKVNRDERTGLKVGWIFDSYPERDKVGPIRLMSIHGFAYPERMMRLGFLRYSPQKMLQSFKSQIAKRGYLKEVWKSNGSFVGKTKDGQTIPSQDDEETYEWPTYVDQATVDKWAKYQSGDADTWFTNELMPRVFDRIQDYFIGPNATLFADGFSNGKNLLYCSQMVVMAFLQGGNLDLQESPDQVWKLITYFSAEIESALKLSLGQRIVSPNGLIWQADIFQNLYQVKLDHSTTAKQMTQLNPTFAQKYSDALSNVLFKIESLKPNSRDEKDFKERTLDDETEIVFDVES